MRKVLRFAALIRVSTEQQEKTGESLRTQRADIESAVKRHGGTIAQRYGGQEHATPGHEKKEIDRLLADAAKNKFDAVIVAHADRWSRDNIKSTEGLRVFEAHNIRFFVADTEYNLFNPEHILFLGMSAVIGNFLAQNQNRKSIQNRIARARRGVPTCGKLPYGRTFDKKTEKWGIDPAKHKIAKDIAKRYLGGESMAHLALEYGVNHASLHKTMMERCGSEWTVEFSAAKLNIKESVVIKIPPLLDEKTIKAMRDKAHVNRTFEHGMTVNKYLFGGMVFCEQCGYSLCGQTNHNGHRYYRHNLREHAKTCPCRPRPWVRADDLEDIVMANLFECFGNPIAVERAIEAATPRMEKLDEYRAQSDRIDAALNKIVTGKKKILKLVANGLVDDGDAEEQLKSLAANEATQTAAKDRLNEFLANLPTRELVQDVAGRISARFTCESSIANHRLDLMTWDERRTLAKMVFSGTQVDGRRLGIYIGFLDDKKPSRRKTWRYTIHGHLIHTDGFLPMSESRKEASFTFGAAFHQRELVAISATC